MSEKKKAKKGINRLLIALLLIIDGIILMNIFFFHYSYETMNNHDKQLMYIARVIDASLDGRNIIRTGNDRLSESFTVNQRKHILLNQN